MPPPLTCSHLSRITKAGLRFDPAVPDDIHRVKVAGVSYFGNKLKFTLTKGEIRIKVTESPRDPPASPLEAVLEASGQRFPLRGGTGVTACARCLKYRRFGGKKHSRISHAGWFLL